MKMMMMHVKCSFCVRQPNQHFTHIKLSLYMDLTEPEDIKKRWQEYTEELYKKDLQDPDNHDGVITD